MNIRSLAFLAAGSLAFAGPLRAADLSPLVAEAAQYESGKNLAPLQRFEQLLRDSTDRPDQRAELETALIQLLGPGATFEARRFACQQLRIIGTEASLPALAELLKADETVGIACLALSTQRSPKAAKILRDALSGARGPRRLQLIGALGNHPDAESAKVLAGLALDADPVVAAAAMVALGKVTDASSRKAFEAVGQQTGPATAWAVAEGALRLAESLAATGDRSAAAARYAKFLERSNSIQLRRGALAALLRLDEDGGEQRILEVLQGSDAALKPVAIAAIGPRQAERASTRFADELPKLTLGDQVLMIEALATRHDAAARSAVRAGVTADNAEVRRAAIVAVGKQEDATAVPLLTQALASAASPEERQTVELALAGLPGGRATDEAITATLRSVSPDLKPRVCAVLAFRGAQAAAPALLTEAKGSEPATVKAAFRALGTVAAPADLPALLEALANLKVGEARADAESAVARTLAKVPAVAQRSEAVRAELAKRPDVDSRGSLLRLLASAADSSSLAVVQAALTDPEPRVREAAVESLAAWPDATAWEPLLSVYRQPGSDTQRTLALRGLVRLAEELNAKPDAALVERYRQLLAGARSDGDRKLILSALAGAAHPEALTLARSLLEAPGVRAEAELAVNKITQAIQGQ